MQQARCTKCKTRWIWSRDLSMRTLKSLFNSPWSHAFPCPGVDCHGEMVPTDHLYKQGRTRPHPDQYLWRSGHLPEHWSCPDGEVMVKHSIAFRRAQ